MFRYGITISLMAMLAFPVAADIMVVRSVETEGLGGMGGAPKQSTVWIAGNKHREEQKGSAKPSMLERMAGVGRPVITRLDKKVRWTLNDPKKTYEEMPLAAPQTEVEEMASEPGASGPGDERSTTRISKAEFKVNPLGKKKTIGAYTCDGYQVRALLEMEDLETRQKSEMRLITYLWTAPETGAVAQLKKEEEAYARAYAKAIGFSDAAQAGMKMLGTAMMAGLAGAGENELSSALAGMPSELKKVQGYPILTRVEWYGKDDAAAQDEGGEVDGLDSAEIPTDVSDALGAFASGFAKKKMATQKPAPTEDGRLMLAMTTEIKSIATAPIPGPVFEVPAGFKQAQ
jgi:hypothetical protein